ncbi:MAG: diaminopimelate epimerase [Rectinemataceae bacterium]|nr:diaminopimelate epimerase [Spirochaetaceae bacterium]
MKTVRRRLLRSGMHFHKYHALGNDYLVIDPAEYELQPTPDIVSRLCDRNRGIGSDGLLWGPLGSMEGGALQHHASAESASPAGEALHASFMLRIFNPDGSEAEKSGNGLRIFSLYLYESGRVGQEPFTVQTRGGEVTCQVGASLPDGGRIITVAMGMPDFAARKAGVGIRTETMIGQIFDVGGERFQATFVSMGNPHCVLLGPSPSPELARRIGPLVEHNPLFPHRTNVQFLEVLDRNTIRIEIWERGAGYTLASGSSSCAAASVARRLGLVDEQVRVLMPGGTLDIDMREPDVRMTGPAVRVFDGVLA